MSTCVCDSDTQAVNPFDPERLKLSQDFAASLGVKKLLTTIPVRKPSKEWWFQTHPDKAYRLPTCVVELKDDQEIYLVDPSLWAELGNESTFGTRVLIPTMNTQGTLFVWPIRMPGPDGKVDSWIASAIEAADRASGRWLRMASNMNLGAYELFESHANWPAPQWPKEPLGDLLKIAFKNRYINDLEHPVLKHLRGEL